MKFSIRGLCLAGLCLTAVFAFGAVGSASAANTLLFESSSGFPYKMEGPGGASKLETVSGSSVTSTSSDLHAEITNKTLFNAHILFLGVKSGIFNCSNTSNSSAVLVSLIGHLGLADPGDKPAVLLLVPTGFEFTCAGFATVKVRGSVIGEITEPAVLVSGQKKLKLKFEQVKGIQKYTEFLLPGGVLDKPLFEESSLGGAFEQSGQEGEGTLNATGTGTFELKDE